MARNPQVDFEKSWAIEDGDTSVVFAGLENKVALWGIDTVIEKGDVAILGNQFKLVALIGMSINNGMLKMIDNAVNYQRLEMMYAKGLVLDGVSRFTYMGGTQIDGPVTISGKIGQFVINGHPLVVHGEVDIDGADIDEFAVAGEIASQYPIIAQSFPKFKKFANVPQTLRSALYQAPAAYEKLMLGEIKIPDTKKDSHESMSEILEALSRSFQAAAHAPQANGDPTHPQAGHLQQYRQ